MNIKKEAEKVVLRHQKDISGILCGQNESVDWLIIFEELAYVDDPIAYDEVVYEEKVIGQELIHEAEKWTPRTPVLLNADMGAGKNRSAKRLAKKGYKEEGMPSALICPRVAIGAQTAVELLADIVGKDKMSGYYHMLEDGMYNELMDIFNAKCKYLKIFTMQSLEEAMACHRFSGEKEYLYVFIDEVQDLWEAAPYRAHTAEALKVFPTVFYKSIRVYMTATDQNIKAFIHEAELSAFWHEAQSESVRVFAGDISKHEMEAIMKELPVKNIMGQDMSPSPWLPVEKQFEVLDNIEPELLAKILYAHDPVMLKRYTFFQSNAFQTVKKAFLNKEFVKSYYYARNCDKLQHYYFQEDDNTAALQRIATYTLKKVGAGEKVFVYVHSIKDGETLLSLLEGVSAVHLYRDAVDNCEIAKKAYSQIIKNATVEHDVLICSPLLEFGVNIRDTRFKTVFIHGVFEVTELLQAQARVRRVGYDADDVVDVIVSLPTKSMLQQQQNLLPSEIAKNKAISKTVDDMKIPSVEVLEHTFQYLDAKGQYHCKYNHFVLDNLQKKLNSITMFTDGSSLTDEACERYRNHYIAQIRAYYNDGIEVVDFEALEEQFFIGLENRKQQQRTAFTAKLNEAWEKMLESNGIKEISSECLVSEQSCAVFREELKISYRSCAGDWVDEEVAGYVKTMTHNRNSVKGDILCGIINKYIDMQGWSIDKIHDKKDEMRKLSFSKSE